jgi:capsular polysaccharide biosynthesis protein
VAQPATLMLKPASPKKGLTLAIALVLASAGAFAVIFLAEFFDESLKSPAEIESRLDLPVLATLPEVSRGLLAST